jgi:hypothetical protein
MVRRSLVELLDAAEAAGYATSGYYEAGPASGARFAAGGRRSWARFAPEITTAASVLMTKLFAVLLAMA